MLSKYEKERGRRYIAGRVAKVPTHFTSRNSDFFPGKGREIEFRRRRPFQTQGREEGGQKRARNFGLTTQLFWTLGGNEGEGEFRGHHHPGVFGKSCSFPNGLWTKWKGEIHQRKVQANLLEKSFKYINVQNGRQNMKGN